MKANNISGEMFFEYEQALAKDAIRAFIAADIPIDFSYVQNYIHEYIDFHFGENLYIPKKKYHLTLFFFGNILTKDLANIISLINKVVSDFMEDLKVRDAQGLPGFYITIHDTFFGSRKKLIVFDLKNINDIWIMLLKKLHDEFKIKLFPYLASTLSISNFVPHITLGTVKIEKLNNDQRYELFNFVKSIHSPVGARGLTQIPPETFDIRSITLYESENGNHIPLARWSLV